MLETFVLEKNSDAYPDRLRSISDAPDRLYGIGNLYANRGHFVSVVGTRRATERGREWVQTFVRELARLVPDVTIVSGLAYGIDVAAHKAAIECGLQTIIIPAHGLDRIYPPIHRPVAEQAVANGGILTEYPVGTEPDGFRFLERDRIIAAMSDCIVVVESAVRGGSLTTAKYARQYGRVVMAVPGRPTDSTSEGCNNLIRDHRAELINSAQDLVRIMGWTVPEQQTLPLFEDTTWLDSLTELQQQIMRLLMQAEDGLHINDLTAQLQLPYATIACEMSLLELDDLVKSLPGGIYRSLKHV